MPVAPEVLAAALTMQVAPRPGSEVLAPVRMRTTGPGGLDAVNVARIAPFSALENLGPDFFGRPLPPRICGVAAGSYGAAATVAFEIASTGGGSDGPLGEIGGATASTRPSFCPRSRRWTASLKARSVWAARGAR